MYCPIFQGQTMYSAEYQNWGAGPGIKPAKEKPKVIEMPIDGKSIYMKDFCEGRPIISKDEDKRNRQKTREMKKNMQASSYAKSLKLPF